MDKQTYPFQNRPLPFGFAALEPYIDAKTMMLHHDRHLQTYIDNLNKYLESRPELQTLTLEELIKQYNSDEVIAHNAGGVYNHEFFFSVLRPGVSQIIIGLSGRLLGAIQRDFGSFENFTNKFSEIANGVFGSGYTWLCLTDDCKLEIIITENQETPLTYDGKDYCPILAIDVWEHAYYLKHFNMRANYIRDFWNVVDWVKVSARLDEHLREKKCVG